MAAPQQVHTADAIHRYRALKPGRTRPLETAGVVIGAPRPRPDAAAVADPSALLPGHLRFGEALARLIERARDPATRAALARELFGIWVSRGFPAAAVQLVPATEGRRTPINRRYEPAPGARLPVWLDPERGGTADPGLFHTVFLPASKLIEIGSLTSPPPDERTALMLDLGQKIANLAQLARERRNRRPWEKFLAAAAVAEDVIERIDARERSHLAEVAEFGSNPGNLRMLTYIPDELPASAPLVVVLHGCTQTAAAYDAGTGWSTLAERHGFALLLPEQRRSNNPLRCFNWFRPQDFARDGGEPESIRQMVDHLVAAHGLDRRRVFVTGLSAGGAMTSVMLATHPDVFAGGAVVAGVPYHCAEGLQEGFEVIFQGRSLPTEEWGDRVRAASNHSGPWPRMQVWHGDADVTVKPLNAGEVVKQWCNVHAITGEPALDEQVGPHRHRVWRDAAGQDIVEHWTVAGLPHGQAIDPQAPDGCGQPEPFIIDAGISSPTHIARSWGLTAVVRDRPAKPRRPATPVEPAADDGEAVPFRIPAVSIPIRNGRRPDAGTADASADTPTAKDQPAAAAQAASAETAKPAAEKAPAPDLAQLIARSLAAAGAGRRKEAGRDKAAPAGGLAGLGIDIPGIIGTSLEAAGLLKGGRNLAQKGATVGGVDIGAILSKSFEAQAQPRPEGEAPSPPRRPRRGRLGRRRSAGRCGRRPARQGLVRRRLRYQREAGLRATRRLVLGETPVLSYKRKLRP
ncbi:MAG: PHB depolymerase family esterase [Rhodospirillales bacterium]